MSSPIETWVTAVGVAGPFADEAAVEAMRDTLPVKQQRQADRAGMLAVAAARHALESAGLEAPQPEVGIVLGVDYGAYPANLAHQRRLLAEGPKRVSPAEFTLTLPNIAAAFASIACGLRGPAATLADGGTAAGSAIGTAFEMIRLGDATALLAGAVEPSDPACDDALRRAGGREPERAEHGAMWLIESAPHALAAGRAPMARLLAYGARRPSADDPPPTDLLRLCELLRGGSQARRTDLWRGPSCAPQVRSLTWESC